jgi:hypothetical protein
MTEKDKNAIVLRASAAEGRLNDYAAQVDSTRKYWFKLHGRAMSMANNCTLKSCRIKVIGDLRGDLTRGNVMMDEITRKRITAFTECDFLMVNSPDAATAQRICEQKLRCYNAQGEAFEQMIKYSTEIAAIPDKGLDIVDGIMRAIEALMQGLKQLIAGLIELIKAAFELLKEAAGVTIKALGWFTKHPSAILVIGGVVGLGALAFIARPYVSILKKVVGAKKKRRRLT